MRTGTLDRRPDPVPAPLIQTTTGYLSVYAPDHPVASKRYSRPYQHRVVLYDKVGPGQHPCYHCGKTLTWHVDLHVDHLDEDKTNNDPSNLVPCCQRCNNWRARWPESFAAEKDRRALRCSNRHEANEGLRQLGLKVGLITDEAV